MIRYAANLFLSLCVVISFLALDSSDSCALDPRFELDTKTLGSQKQAGAKQPAQTTTQETKAVKNIEKKRAVRGRAKQRRVFRGNAPAVDRKTFRKAKAASTDRTANVVQSFRMSAARNSDGADLYWTKTVWNRLFVSGRNDQAPLTVSGRNFSLSLDPERYPVLPAADGGRIVVDASRTLSPLVKTIIQEKDPNIRIVSENTADRRRFFSALFAAARFYSVEENFSVGFGSDPKLTVTADFKIEKTPESLLKNEVVLVNVNEQQAGMPESLRAFLKAEGFQVVDSSPVYTVQPDGGKSLYSIQVSNQQDIVDTIFSALSVSYERDRDVVLDDGSRSGVMLSVRADRYCATRGKGTVFSFAEENPVQYTLLRLLELKGYRVVMLHPADGFRAISEKVLASLGVPSAYGVRHLFGSRVLPFDVQISGFAVSDEGRNGKRVFLTNSAIDPLIRILAVSQGYDVITK